MSIAELNLLKLIPVNTRTNVLTFKELSILCEDRIFGLKILDILGLSLEFRESGKF